MPILSLMNDVNPPTFKSMYNKFEEKNIFFIGVLQVTDEKSRIRSRIRNLLSKVRIRGSGSVPKCHESGTLVGRKVFCPHFRLLLLMYI